MVVDKIDEKYIPEICKLHSLVFDKSHFTSYFSYNLLFKYFTCLIKFNQLSFVAINDNQVVGFIIAGHKTDQALKFFTKHNLFPIFFLLLIHPSFLVEKIYIIFRKMIYSNQEKSKANFRLHLIAVKKDCIIKNIGRLLLDYFENELIKNEIKLYGLSVRTNNNHAIKFYEKNNFIIEHLSKKSIRYLKYL